VLYKATTYGGGGLWGNARQSHVGELQPYVGTGRDFPDKAVEELIDRPIGLLVTPKVLRHILFSAMNSFPYLGTYVLDIPCKKSMLAPYHHLPKNIFPH
jgi:hypothetical protein